MLHPLVLGTGVATIDGAIDHLDHAVKAMGAEHVGLGGDFTRQVVRALGYDGPADTLLPEGMALDAAVEGLEGPGDYPTLAAALRRRGYEGDLRGSILSGNFLRLFRETLPKEAGP